MDYKYDSAGIELLLTHMNIEDIIDAVENLYHTEEEEEEAAVSFEESLSQEAMDENEETVDSGDIVVSGTQENGRVRYGTVSDLLTFVNLISDMQPTSLQQVPKEMGVLLNKVSVSGTSSLTGVLTCS